jgi:predicted acyltransferase
VYPWLRHAGWSGYSVADLVFPFFLFAVGASQSFSCAAAAHTGRLPPCLFLRMLRRTAMLFVLGIFLNALPGLLQAGLYGTAFDIGSLRIMGVLQRIALVYFAAGMCIVYLSKRMLWLAIGLVLAGYWAALEAFPGSLTPDNNPALLFDRLLFGTGHLYKGALDPEGLFSSVSALTTTLLGYQAGAYLRSAQGELSAALKLFAAGILAIALGSFWGLWLPVSKDLWTGSYTLITAGWAGAVFSLCQAALHLETARRIGAPLLVMGRNALFFFVSSAVAARFLLAVKVMYNGQEHSCWSLLHQFFFVSWLGATELSSCAFAAAYLAAWLPVLYLLELKGWYFKA